LGLVPPKNGSGLLKQPGGYLIHFVKIHRSRSYDGHNLIPGGVEVRKQCRERKVSDTRAQRTVTVVRRGETQVKKELKVCVEQRPGAKQENLAKGNRGGDQKGYSGHYRVKSVSRVRSTSQTRGV